MEESRMRGVMRSSSSRLRFYSTAGVGICLVLTLGLLAIGNAWLSAQQNHKTRERQVYGILDIDAALLKCYLGASDQLGELEAPPANRALPPPYRSESPKRSCRFALESLRRFIVLAEQPQLEPLLAKLESLLKPALDSGDVTEPMTLTPEQREVLTQEFSAFFAKYHRHLVQLRYELKSIHSDSWTATISSYRHAIFILLGICSAVLAMMFLYIIMSVNKKDRLLTAIINAIPEPIVVKDWNGDFVFCNEAVAKLYNSTPEAMIGKNDFDFTGNKEQADFFRNNVREIMRRFEAESVYEDSTNANTGEIRHFHSLKIPFMNFNDEVNIVVIAKDVTELTVLKNAAQRNEMRLESIFEVSGEGLWDWNTQTNEVLHNRQWELITGVMASENSFEEFERCILEEDRPKVQAALQALIKHNKPYNIEFRMRRPDGEVIWIWDRGQVVERDEQGNALWLVGIMQDITKEKSNQEKIETLAFYDSLTNLPNRSLLEDRLRQAVKANQRRATYGAVLFIDLDRFKQLNDTYGHYMGDILLIQAAERIQAMLRTDDTVARFGGDEFVIVLGDLGVDPVNASLHAEVVAEKVRSSLSEVFHLGSKEEDNSIDYFITASVGGVIFKTETADPAQLLQMADLALYKVKTRGRNDSVIFDPDMQSELSRTTKIKRALRQSINDEQFSVYFQPQFDDAQNLVGAEALIRWSHQEFGMIPPSEFIAIAEESNLIKLIGYFVLDQACQRLVEWQADPKTADLQLSINISAKQIWHKDFVQDINEVISKYEFNYNKLTLEITESVLLQDLDDALEKLVEIKNLGLCLSLDDFGTGYSSLSYLKNLPIDEIKIDRTFIRDILDDHSDRLMVKSIIDLGRNFGIKVVSEGVEEKAQSILLKTMGCTLYQGYYFGHPVPYDQFKELFAAAPSAH